MLDALLYTAYVVFLIVVYLFLSAVIVFRAGNAERWLNFSLDYLLVVIVVTYLFFGRVPMASRVFEGLQRGIAQLAGISLPN